jgi:hypothetical protein
MGAFCGKVNKIAALISEVDDKVGNLFYTPTYTEKDLSFYKDGQLPPLSGKKVANKFKGDIFELFTEFFIKMSPIDDRIDVYDYQLVTGDDDGIDKWGYNRDTGVDGWGYNRNGEVVTVQVKYRGWDWELKATKDHLETFRLTSFEKFDIDPKATGRMLIVTTGKAIHWETLERHFSGKVRCISNNASYGCLRGASNRTIDDLFSLQSLVNDNMMFWKSFEENIERKK